MYPLNTSVLLIYTGGTIGMIVPPVYINNTEVLLIYTGGTIGMIENTTTGALER